VPDGAVVVQASLRSSVLRGDQVWITGRAARRDADDARELLHAVGTFRHDGVGFALDRLPVGPTGDAVVHLDGDVAPEVTDSDPFFADWHPWLRPLPHTDAERPEAARRTADALTAYLRWARRTLAVHPINSRRGEAGDPPLDTLTTTWIGRRGPVPPLSDRIGTSAAMIASTGLYRGLAALLGAHHHAVAPAATPQADMADMADRLAAAAALLRSGTGFVHVHTKATDEAGHTKDPRRKLEILEAMDPAFAALHEPPFTDAVVAVTGDHATPSRDTVLHSGDPTPFVAAGPTVHPDRVEAFGEAPAAGGSLGALRAEDVLPVLLGMANRAVFRGHRCTAHPALGLPDDPVPMPPT
jgi:2,3-bisphosphoglycerate-independent phosphoglycerate mutase